MKVQNVIMVMLITLFISCGGKQEKKKSTNSSSTKKAAVKKEPAKKAEKKVTNAEIIDLNNKGIGPIKSLKLADKIDDVMVAEGKLIFKNKCSACHKTTKKFIGPNPTGLLERRSPEWAMNMILNPDEMVRKDPIAKQLLMKFNGSPMANQNLTEKEARAVLEYFRTL